MNTLIKQLTGYQTLSKETKKALLNICEIENFEKSRIILSQKEYARHHYFLSEGCIAYYKEKVRGNPYYTNFFEENTFIFIAPSILKSGRSTLGIHVLEDSTVIKFPTKAFHELLKTYHDLALAYMKYLEWNWLAGSVALEIDIKLQDVEARYHALRVNEKLFNRLDKFHIALYLGISEQQLSSIARDE